MLPSTSERVPAASPQGLEPDVVVIGGGPAGSTIATRLAGYGWRVVLAEKDLHPRFHIGESLLPMNLPLFDALGVSEQVAAIGMPKYGAQFVSQSHGKAVTYNFGGALNKNFPLAYQVRRADLDHILIDNARRHGVQVHEQCRVSAVRLAGPGQRARVEALARSGESLCWQPRFVVDATGRDTLLARQLHLKRKNPRHASSAMYAHFRGAERLSGREEGNISVFWFDHGWFWFIPLTGGLTSVGAVCWPYYLHSRRTDPERFFLQTISSCPALADRLRGAQLASEVSATGNYSYSAKRAHGEGYLLVGDAYAFIDPVFSSGVFLAMQGAFCAAEALDCALREPRRAAAALGRYERTVRRGLGRFTWFIYRMTSPSLRDMFMNPRNLFGIEEALLSLLSGDVYRNPGLRLRIALFKCIYYGFNLASLGRSIAAWRRHRQQIRTSPAEAAGA